MRYKSKLGRAGVLLTPPRVSSFPLPLRYLTPRSHARCARTLHPKHIAQHSPAMSHSLIRALSPSLDGVTRAIIDTNADMDVDDKSHAAAVARHSNIAGADSVADIIKLIPSDYA